MVSRLSVASVRKRRPGRIKICEKHVGAKVTYVTVRYRQCPLCEALDKIADYEISD